MARSVLPLLLLVVVAAAVHARVGAHGYLGEGDGVVTENPLIERGLSTAGLSRLFVDVGREGDRPLTRLWSMAIVELAGSEPGPQHLASALLHVLNAVLVLAALRRFGTDAGLALFVAFAFALHPLVVEPVAWIAQRGRLLATTFALASLWFWALQRREPSPVRYAAALSTFVVGLLAHPFVAALPLVYLARPTERGAQLRGLAPFLLLGALAFAASWALAPDTALAPAARLAGAPLAVGFLAALLCAPFGLAYHYPHPALDVDDALPVVVTAIAALVLLAFSVAALRRRDSWISTGWLWFAGAAFVSVLLPYDVALGGDRDAYFAVIGFGLCIGAGARALARRLPSLRAALPYAAGATVLFWAWTSTQRVQDWRDSASLNARALDVTTRNAVAHRNLARDLSWRGKLTAAGDQLALALARRPGDPEAQLLQADLELQRARHAAATRRSDREVRHLEEAERICQDVLAAELLRPAALHRLGEIDQRRGDRPSLLRAEEHLASAVELAPLWLESHQRLGMVRLGLFELEGARKALEQAVALSPDTVPDGWGTLGLVALQAGNHDEARRCFLRALEIEPDYVEARTNLGRILYEAGEVDAAEVELVHALSVHPHFTDALYHLGKVYEAQGRIDEALVQLERTVKQDARHIRANMSLAWLYAESNRTEEGVERADVVLAHAGGVLRQAEARALLGRIALHTGEWETAREHLEEAVARDPQRSDDRVRLALLLAAAPDDSVRDGEAALELARRCVQLTQGKDPQALEALACAQAELGDFEEAAETQRAALGLFAEERRGPPRARLALFEAAAPYRLKAGGDE